MGRKRVIDTDELLFDEELYELIGEKGLWVYVRLWSLAEDWGGYEPKYGSIALKMGVLKMSTEEIRSTITKLISVGKIIPYQVPGLHNTEFHWIKNLLKHQPLNNPAPPNLPLPPWITCQIKEYASKKKYASYRIDLEKLASCTSTLLVEYQNNTDNSCQGNSTEDKSLQNHGSLPHICKKYLENGTKVKSQNEGNGSHFDGLNIGNNSENKSQSSGSLPVALETKRNRNETETRKALSAEPTTSPKISVKNLVKIWNENAPTYLPRVKSLSDKRGNKLKRNMNGFDDPEWWRNLFRDIDLSDFYSGRDGKWNGMDFDWAVANCEKLRSKLDRASHKIPESPQEVGPAQCRDSTCPRCRGHGTFRSGMMPDGSPSFAICYGVKNRDGPSNETTTAATT